MRLSVLWRLEFASGGHCTLCGNHGYLDTTLTAVTATGMRCGRLNYCICPNGRELKREGVSLEALRARNPYR